MDTDISAPDDYRKIRRTVRRHLNSKYKHRDRWKPKGASWLYQWHTRHYGEGDYEFNRRKSPTETGFGVAYEDNPDAKKYKS